ncbi:MAG: protein translocase subunit SecDF, partial [Chitinophagaceae bacterium]|nr:protein translocase subunit SecDF [Chitinophagaceae bacterium]
MQLKGLVRFFTVLLIIYSLYQLSFTWFVRSHEKKMEAKAMSSIKKMYPDAKVKYPNNPDSQAIYQEMVDKEYQKRLQRLLDSTKDKTVTYGINGAVSYKKAKAEELNLGLDLQGGMNVTLEVEMTGLLRSLTNDSKDPNFLLAIQNANNRKLNSGADFVTLFIEEYRKLEKTRPLASLFAGGASGKIDINSSDSKVESYIRKEANDAFDRTYNKLTKRIDQFGVAQPAINPIKEKNRINVELPGVKDKDRVRKLLQTTANLQFWETYRLQDLQQAFINVENDFDGFLKGTLKDTAAAPAPDTT